MAFHEPDRPRSFGSPLVLALVFLISLPAVTHRLNASDEIEYFAWLRSVAFDRDVDFENEYQHFYDVGGARDAGFHETFLERTNERGRRHNFAPVGTAVLWAPWYGVGHLTAGWLNAPQDGYSAPYIRSVTYASAVYGCLALLLSMAIVRRTIGRGAGSVWLVWIGTPLIFYMYIAPGFAHATSAFAVALFLYTWLRVRDHWSLRGAVVLGVTAGLVPMVREQDVFFLAGPACDFIVWAIWGQRARMTFDGPPPARTGPGRIFGVAAAGLAACAVTYLPQLTAYVALNGHPGPDQTVQHKMNWMSPHALDVLVSLEHGLFIWTPLAAIAVLGLIRLAAGGTRDVSPDTRWLGVLAVLMVALQVYVSGCVESWTVAGSFGQRRFVALTPLLALGLAAFVPPRRDRYRTSSPLLASIVAGLCLWWNLGLMAQFGLHRMDRQRLNVRENARVTFVELPRQAPAIAWRYLTDRASFYRLPRR